MSVHEIVNMESQLGMTYAPYCYEEFIPSDDEDDYHIDRVEVEEEDEEDVDAKLVEPVNQYMTPSTLKFKVVSVDDHYESNDWANSRRHSSLLVNELEVGKHLETSLNVLLY